MGTLIKFPQREENWPLTPDLFTRALSLLRKQDNCTTTSLRDAPPLVFVSAVSFKGPRGQTGGGLLRAQPQLKI